VGGSGPARVARGAVLLAALAGLAVAAAVPSMARPADSGVTGVVRGQAACMPPPQVRCQARPLRTRIEVLRASDGARVATARPSPLGVLRVRLTPGRYVLRVLSPRAGTKLMATRPVRVRPHAFTFMVIAASGRGGTKANDHRETDVASVVATSTSRRPSTPRR
jgi:hypothetical protein